MTDVAGLASFLIACIQADVDRLDLPEFEEEDSARGPGWGNRGDCLICGAHQWSGTEAVTEEAWWDHAENTHGRSRVLADCEAKREIVGWCSEILGQRNLDTYGQPGALKADPDALAVTLAVETLRLLALPYADRPGYREEWRP